MPNQLRILSGKVGRHSFGVCFPEIKIKLMMAKKGAVKNDKIVAIFIKNPISDLKKIRIKIVPTERKLIQNQYIFLYDLLVSNSKAFVIALGDASKVVIVVLNIVVNAAAAIKIYISWPKFLV